MNYFIVESITHSVCHRINRDSELKFLLISVNPLKVEAIFDTTATVTGIKELLVCKIMIRFTLSRFMCLYDTKN